MPRLSPFVGLVFDPSRVGPLERVTAPPYDAISPEERTRLHHASEANIVRLILAEERPGDDADRNKYTRASDLLRSWRADGTLVPTEGPRIYPYEMRFRFRGEPRSVRGVIATIGTARRFAPIEYPVNGLLVLAEIDHAEGYGDSVLSELRSSLGIWAGRTVWGLSVGVHLVDGLVIPYEISITSRPAFPDAKVLAVGQEAVDTFELLTEHRPAARQ